MKGVDTTMGYIGWIGGNLGVTEPKDVHKIESQLTKELLSLGAVLYVKVRLYTFLKAETLSANSSTDERAPNLTGTISYDYSSMERGFRTLMKAIDRRDQEPCNWRDPQPAKH